jgi:hypothetical protein
MLTGKCPDFLECLRRISRRINPGHYGRVDVQAVDDFSKILLHHLSRGPMNSVLIEKMADALYQVQHFPKFKLRFVWCRI